MLEYIIYLKSSIDDKHLYKLIDKFESASILIDEPTYHHFIKENILVIYRHRFDYQGSPVCITDNGFCAITGYIVSKELKNNSDTIVKQVNSKLFNGNTEWLDDSLGEFQIIHLDTNTLNFHLSKVMTHPLYYYQEGGEVFVSNRSSLIANSLPSYPSIHSLSQLEVIAFDSTINGNSAFEGIRCLSPGEILSVSINNDGHDLDIKKSNFRWSDETTTSLSMKEAHLKCHDLADWLVDHLAILPKQVKIPNGMSFNLSGGKDSRLLLALFVKSGFIKYFDHALTFGNVDDAEVIAAKLVAKHYQIKHIIKPRTVPSDRLFELLPLHLFQLEGEISCRVLHGNHLGRRKPVFTGHEAGLRETFAKLDVVNDFNSVEKYIDEQLPIDPIGIIKSESKELIYQSFRSLKAVAINEGVQGHNFFNWYSIVSRVHRWAGKLTSMSSAAGLYANILCSTPVVKLAHQLGYSNRKNEIFHFSMLAALDPSILKIPFANQDWSRIVLDEFSDLYALTENKIESGPTGDKQWWDEVYGKNNGISLINVIESSRNEFLDCHIDYDILYKYIRKMKKPSSRAMLSIFSVLSAHILYSNKGILTLDGVEELKEYSIKMRTVYNDATDDFNNAPYTEKRLNSFFSAISKFISVK